MAFPIPSEKRVPSKVSQWKELAEDWCALGSISELGSQEKVKSASRFEFKHFLGLRVIYEQTTVKSRIPETITSQFSGPGLDELQGWKAYLDEIERFPTVTTTVTRNIISRTYVPMTLGPLTNVWQFQRHVMLGDTKAADMSKISEVSPVVNRTRARTKHRELFQTPTPAPRFMKSPISDAMADLTIEERDHFGAEAGQNSRNQIGEESNEGTAGHENTTYEDDSDADSDEVSSDSDPTDGFYTPARDFQGRLIKDEQTVNVFLLALLSAITATTVPFHTRWSAERNAMVFKKNVRYTARTDGHLRNERGQSFSLIEVKPRPRADDVTIRVQESAQMAAWISQNGIKSHDLDSDCNIFLLSQDKDELYVTFPQFGEAYGKDNKPIEKLKETDFLRMREYGPFTLTSRRDVNHIATFLHAYTLHVSKH